jgi:cell division protein FtsL
MRGKSVDLKLIHNSYQDQLMDNEEPIVWHEPILDEYWSRLEAEMNQLDIDTKIGRIEITNVEMTKECLAALVAIIHALQR